MKLLKVITISISLFLFCTQLFAGSVPKEQNDNLGTIPSPIWLGDDLKFSMPAFLWRHTQYLGYRLNKNEKMQHQSAVFFMLNNAKNGEVVSWYSDKRLAGGKVRVIHS